MHKETKQKAPSESSRHAAAMLGVMESLSGVMDQEVILLEKQDMAALDVLRVEKARWSYQYHANMKTLSARPDMLRGLSQEERTRLKEAGTKLALSVGRNADHLKSAILATQALVQTVMDAARKNVMTNECYTRPDNNGFMTSSYSPITAPVAVDRSA